MTEEAQRIAIAEFCGWKWYRTPATGPWAAKPHRALYHPNLSTEYVSTLQLADMTERECNPVFLWREGMIPDFFRDLNAMNSAEGHLTDLQWEAYTDALIDALGNANAITSSPSTRAEFLLKTIGKWLDEPAAPAETPLDASGG